jgi:hypothetical protein
VCGNMKKNEKDRKREKVCVCVCVCEDRQGRKGKKVCVVT